MTQTMFQRALDRMVNPAPNPLRAELDAALERNRKQSQLIEAQRKHIKALDARIERLEHEAGGLRDLF